MKILIPTYLDREQVAELIADVEKHSPGCEVFASCTKASASVNRNLCLDQIEVGDVAVMIDDDIRGFYEGWVDDLLKGLELPNAVMVSARLLNRDGTFGPTCSRCMEPSPEEIEVKSNGTAILPTAAIAFRHTGVRYEIAYQGSGFEDSDFCQQLLHNDPSCTFWQSNRCRLIHDNLMRGQKGANWRHNLHVFNRKWRGKCPA